MKKIKIGIIMLLVVFFVLPNTAFSGRKKFEDILKNDKQIDTVEQSLTNSFQQVEQNNKELDITLNKAKEDKKLSKKEIKKIQKKLTKYKKSLRKLKNKVSQLEDKIERLEAKLAE